MRYSAALFVMCTYDDERGSQSRANSGGHIEDMFDILPRGMLPWCARPAHHRRHATSSSTAHVDDWSQLDNMTDVDELEDGVDASVILPLCWRYLDDGKHRNFAAIRLLLARLDILR